MKNRILWRVLAVPAVAGTMLLSGCNVIRRPQPVPVPPVPPAPKPGIFNSTDYVTHGVALNVANDPNLPDYFDVTRVDAADLLWLRSVDSTTINNQPQLEYGTADVVRLAGIVTPQKGQPGWHEAVQTVQNWTLGQKLTVEQDPQYPLDTQHRRRVQVFFMGREGGPLAGQTLDLNRMLIRSGYAVVDLTQPTIFNTQGWLNDEQYARGRNLGLWGMGILLDHRLPLPLVTSTPSSNSGTAPKQVRPAPAPIGAP
ncbi:MAG: thermonuclease family protein [Abditibacteriaceae bacterium]